MEQIADDLLSNFGDLDADGSGGLTLAEARVETAGLTQAQFNQMDANSNGELSKAELEAQLPEELPWGCNLPQSKR